MKNDFENVSHDKPPKTSDEWNGFADLLANLIEKYAEKLEIDRLPIPSVYIDKSTTQIKNI